MKLMLDSAHLCEIKEAVKLDCIDAITTNPTILLKNGVKRTTQLARILELSEAKLFVQMLGNTSKEMYQDFEDVCDFFTTKNRQFIAKVPINKVGLEVIQMIHKNYPGQEILGTAIYTIEQAILAIISHCEYIAPYFNRIQKLGGDPKQMIADTRNYIEQSQSTCKIVAASFKTKQQVMDAWLAGAHTCTVSYEVLESLMTNDIVEEAVNQFNLDGYKLQEVGK